jgi:hypothetical protein
MSHGYKGRRMGVRGTHTMTGNNKGEHICIKPDSPKIKPKKQQRRLPPAKSYDYEFIFVFDFILASNS